MPAYASKYLTHNPVLSAKVGRWPQPISDLPAGRSAWCFSQRRKVARGSLWFAIKVHHSSCNANTGITCLGLDLGNPSRPILSHTQVLLCHSWMRSGFENSPLRRSGRAGGLPTAVQLKAGLFPRQSPCIFSKGAFECQAVGSKVLSTHQRFCFPWLKGN